MSESGACGGSSSSLFMVSAIFNCEFIVGYPTSNEFFVVKGGSLRSVLILFYACLKKSSNFTSRKGYSWGIRVTVSQSRTWFVLGK